MKHQIIILSVIIVLTSCNQKQEPILITSADFNKSVDKVGEVMVHDIFSPPVASRVFTYPNIAAYEIIAQNNDDYKSLAGQVTDLKSIPKADTLQPLNFQLAALIAHIDLSKRLIFSEQKIEVYRNNLSVALRYKSKSFS